MNKRDLRSGFELLEAGFHPSGVELVGIAEHAIERAIKAEALARELAEVLLLYEKWEAKVIMDDSLWQSASGLPFITQEVWDDLVAVQGERNKVLHKAKEVLGDE